MNGEPKASQVANKMVGPLLVMLLSRDGCTGGASPDSLSDVVKWWLVCYVGKDLLFLPSSSLASTLPPLSGLVD